MHRTTYSAEKHGLPEADHRASRRSGVTLSYVCPRKEAVQLVVCGLRRSVRLEGPGHSLGHTRKHGRPRSKSVSNMIIALKHSANQLKDGGSKKWTGSHICQAIFQGVGGSEWETMYCKYVELHKAVKCKNSEENKKAKALWSLKEAIYKGIDL